VAEIDPRPVGRITLPQGLGRTAEAIGRFGRAEQAIEATRHLGQGNAILWSFGTGQRGNDGRQIEAHDARVVDLARPWNAEQSLGAEIGFEQPAVRFTAARASHVADRFLVDREKAHRRTVFRRHVGQCRAVSHRQRGRTLAKILDKGADHLFAPQQLGHRQHQIGGGDALAQTATEFDADHVGRQKIDRLTEHRRFRLDAADPPADHAKGVDHRGVRVGTDQRVRENTSAPAGVSC
jgi:hypothetical protein